MIPPPCPALLPLTVLSISVSWAELSQKIPPPRVNATLPLTVQFDKFAFELTPTCNPPPPSGLILKPPVIATLVRLAEVPSLTVKTLLLLPPLIVTPTVGATIEMPPLSIRWIAPVVNVIVFDVANTVASNVIVSALPSAFA